jgi:hypothetical protein
MHDCSSKRVLVVKDDGDADCYQSLIVQRMLSTQMERVEQNQ